MMLFVESFIVHVFRKDKIMPLVWLFQSHKEDVSSADKSNETGKIGPFPGYFIYKPNQIF